MLNALPNPTPHFGVSLGPSAGVPVLMRKGKEKENNQMIQEMIELIKQNKSIIEQHERPQE